MNVAFWDWCATGRRIASGATGSATALVVLPQVANGEPRAAAMGATEEGDESTRAESKAGGPGQSDCENDGTI
jgi:hypothetical protein